MSTKILVALPVEIPTGMKEIHGCEVVFMGVAKLSACICALEQIHLGATKIVNIGSCGSKKHKVGTLLKVGKFLQDLDCTPLCEYGYTPFTDEREIQHSDGASCFTTDTFYDKNKSHLSDGYLNAINQVDCFDMESFAIAKVCKQHNVPFSCYKWVSDDGDGSDWQENCQSGFAHFLSEYSDKEL